MKKLNLIAFLLLVVCSINAQNQGVKIGASPNTLNPNAILELESTNKGVLQPRVNLTSTLSPAPMSAHVAGMTVFNLVDAGTKPTNVFKNCWYYNDGNQWLKIEAQECANFVAVVKNVSTSTPPSTPNQRDAYLVKATGTGAWAGKDKQVATWDTFPSPPGTGHWNFYIPATCDQILDESTGLTYAYNTANTWVTVPGDNTSFWKLGGNVNASTTSNVVGTLNSVPMRIIAAGAEVLRLDNASWSVQGPFNLNSTAGGFYNFAYGLYDTLLGGIGASFGYYNKIGVGSYGDFTSGYANKIGNSSHYNLVTGAVNTLGDNSLSSIVGGSYNKLNRVEASIVGGYYNVIQGITNHSNLIVGYEDTVSGATYMNIIGGQRNKMSDGSHNLLVGANNKLSGNNYYSGIFGYGNVSSYLQSNLISGQYNVITGTNNHSNIIAGYQDTMTGLSFYNAIFGVNNRVDGSQSNVVGGSNNRILPAAHYNLLSGFSNTIAINSHYNLVTGYSNTVGSSSTPAVGNVASGYLNTVVGIGNGAYAIGYQNNVTNADRGFAFGTNNTVNTGFNNQAYGYGNTVNATGGMGLAMGNSNTVTGNTSGYVGVALGHNNTASGLGAFALGLSANRTGQGMNITFNAGTVSFDGTATWAFSSDRKLKENIQPMTWGLAEVMKMKPSVYNYKTMPGVQSQGFIAQEMQEVIPSVVKDIQDGKGTLGIAYSDLIPVLTKAIQEQQAQIEALKAEIKAMKVK